MFLFTFCRYRNSVQSLKLFISKNYFSLNILDQKYFSSGKTLQGAMDLSPTKKVDLSGMRTPYIPDDIKQDFSVKDPFKLFEVWFNKARDTESIKEANAMAVATADKSGKPSVRYVLLKSFSKEGFVFFTNYNSQKGREITENPNVALLFYWEALCRQVRIVGTVVKSDAKDSETYFHSRPKTSQLSAVTSAQSEVIENKEALVKKRELLEAKYSAPDSIIPRPEYWGGYLVVPESFEFWCGRSDRLHDRIRFRRQGHDEKLENFTYPGEDGWVYEYLSP